jgi:hypothetical protein
MVPTTYEFPERWYQASLNVNISKLGEPERWSALRPGDVAAILPGPDSISRRHQTVTDGKGQVNVFSSPIHH